MAISAGETLSLNNLAGATGFTQSSNVSLGTIKGSPQAGDNISLSSFGVDSIDSINGFTYAVESTSEQYVIQFTGNGTNFNNKIRPRSANYTWSVSPSYNSAGNVSGYLDLPSSPAYNPTISIGAMNPQGAGSQTSLLGSVSHTLSSTFDDGFNDHATNFGDAITKTVHSVDSYDSNASPLCLTSDSPILKSDGTIVEIGDLEEGDILSGYSLNGLSEDESAYLDWSTDSLSTSATTTQVVSIIYSFADRYYNINSDEIKATAEHPLLVKDSSDDNYKFKTVSNIQVGDKLIKGDSTEVAVTSITAVNSTTEIVSIDVETNDTYLVNGYITHNKGGNSHTDEGVTNAPTTIAYNQSTRILSWAQGGGTEPGGNTYDFDIDNNSDFSSPSISRTQYSNNEFQVILSAGTYHLRVREYSTNGLLSAYSTTTSFVVL
jgi:hypothetical protein